MKKIILILFLLSTSELLQAQTYNVGVSYGFLIDKSQNVIDKNIVDYTKNDRIELSILSANWYAHLGLESTSFSENAVITNSSTNHTSYLNNPGNLYDLRFLTIGLGWQNKPFPWLRFISGFTSGFLIHSEINFNNALSSGGYIVFPLNDLPEKEEAIEKLRFNLFQAIQLEYELKNKVTFTVAYKFEVPLLPLISNESASSYFILANEASESHLQFLSLGISFGF